MMLVGTPHPDRPSVLIDDLTKTTVAGSERLARSKHRRTLPYPNRHCLQFMPSGTEERQARKAGSNIASCPGDAPAQALQPSQGLFRYLYAVGGAGWNGLVFPTP
jgi:hypothetical protein